MLRLWLLSKSMRRTIRRIPVNAKRSIVVGSCGLFVLAGWLVGRPLANARTGATHAAPSQVSTSGAIPHLYIDAVVQHGDIVEIKGRTESATAVMINGEPAAMIFADSGFRHFVGPLPPGVSLVSVTAQSGMGGVVTQQLAVEPSDAR